jgi:lipopolysaccharide/colanic/teichoic acid biosynthesis glycosyltransferase
MTRLFIDEGNATVGDVLAFIDDAAKEGAGAAVPSGCLPVLAACAGVRPSARGEHSGCFVFPCCAPKLERASCWERAAAALLLLALSPLLLLIGLAVWAADGRPVLFGQERYGLGGRPFRMLKYRTMVPHSAREHQELQAGFAQAGRLFKLERDPRVTRTGALLRRTFADELPQLLNVARGEMRLVGPRPLPASDQGCYTRPAHALRLQGVPGMTGLWQVSGRNARTFDEMCLLDAYYLRNRSWRLDARILARTLWLLLKQIRVKSEA